jgi:hypothetical protein
MENSLHRKKEKLPLHHNRRTVKAGPTRNATPRGNRLRPTEDIQFQKQSRTCRRGIRIFTPDKEKLSENTNRSSHRPLALELAAGYANRFLCVGAQEDVRRSHVRACSGCGQPGVCTVEFARVFRVTCVSKLTSFAGEETPVIHRRESATGPAILCERDGSISPA